MPVSPTYPGVYIQEVDSGSRVISGVATSITAFVGRTVKGPMAPTTLYSYGDFEKFYGGRARDLPMTYAVEDFFNNGGSQAVVQRICCGAPLGSPSTIELLTTPTAYTLTTKMTGDISKSVELDVAEHQGPDGKPSGTYDLTFKLGPLAILGQLTDVAPELFDMQLKTLTNVVAVSGVIDADGAKTVLSGLVGKPAKFDKGANASTIAAAQFYAADLTLEAAIAGPWVDALSVTIAPDGAKYSLLADHPSFSVPLKVPFTTLADLTTNLAKTGLLTVKNSPADLADAQKLKAFIATGIPLVRVPDGSGASMSMLLLGPLVLTAQSPGTWGNDIAVCFDKANITLEVALRFADYGITDPTDFWNITVYYPFKSGQSLVPAESIGPVYVGTIDAPCRIDHMLLKESQLIAAHPPVAAPTARQLILNPALIGTADPADTTGKTKIGVLRDGADGESLSTDLIIGDLDHRTGMYGLENVDLFNIMVITPDPLLGGDGDMTVIYSTAANYCAQRRAILIADPLDQWGYSAKKGQYDRISPVDLTVGELVARRSVFTYFPRVKKLDPMRGNREMVFSAGGIIAGIFASTDLRRGVWKAPAGIEAAMNGVTGLEHKLTDMQNGVLNQVGINVLRDFPIIGRVVWGSRTLAGADVLSDDYKYLPSRRLTNYIEESLLRSTKFAVFEPNAEPLWATLRLAIGAFMADLARQGAFYDYYVRCDKSTTTPYDIDRGRVNVIVAFAPVKPAEFVILTIAQLAGQTAAA